MSRRFAAMRDASWWNSPGRAAVYHVCREDKPSLSECGAAVWLAADYGCYADEIPLVDRCRRPGCREAFERETGKS